LNLLFAWRYFRSKKSTNAINIIAWISMIAISVGCAALIIVLSVFNGFEDLVKGLYADFYADVRIAPAKGKTFHMSTAQIELIRTTNGIAAMSFVAEEKAVLKGGSQSIVSLKGVDGAYTSVTRINAPEHIARGRFELGTVDAPQLVVGVGIENAAMLDIDRQIPVTIYLPNKKATRLTADDGLHSYNLVPAGAFVVQQDFDIRYAFTNLAFVKYMLGMTDDEFSFVELKTRGDANQVRNTLQSRLGDQFLVETRYEQNRSLYAVMQIEKWVIYGILSLILIVAAFNMIGALTMLVLEKQKDIAVLKAMGASDQTVQRIFLSEGMLLAFIGGGVGICLASLFCWLQLKFKLIKLGGVTFIIDYYPVKMMPSDFMLVIATIVLIALLAAWIPARKAGLQLFSLKS
jgi:lipoprotein-releasing system permease protein